MTNGFLYGISSLVVSICVIFTVSLLVTIKNVWLLPARILFLNNSGIKSLMVERGSGHQLTTAIAVQLIHELTHMRQAKS